MTTEQLAHVRTQVSSRIAEIREATDRLSPLDLYARMDAIRQLAAAHGLDALEGLARRSAQVALLPGSRIATRTCLERIGDALESHSDRDRTAILASLAIRLH